MHETVNILACVVEADKIIKGWAVKYASADIPQYPPGTPESAGVQVPLQSGVACAHDLRASRRPLIQPRLLVTTHRNAV